MKIDAPSRSRWPALRRLWKQAFGDTDEFLDAFEATALDTERCRCVTVDGAVAAALYWFDCSCYGARVAYVYAVATDEAHRGRGFCRALMRDTHDHLARLGYQGVILVPGSRSLFDLYEKMGYHTCSSVDVLRCAACAETVTLERIGAEEYGRLRRKYLPQGGVIQENESLRFLQTQATLYKGEGFLLAARVEDRKLVGVELLGDRTVAAAIVHALGCSEGVFRTVGQGVPFAMYLPLGERGAIPPTYFGLAFD